MAILKNTEVSGALKATSFVKSGGLPSEILKADGSVESSNNYVKTADNQTITGNKTFTGVVFVPDVTIS